MGAMVLSWSWRSPRCPSFADPVSFDVFVRYLSHVLLVLKQQLHSDLLCRGLLRSSFLPQSIEDGVSGRCSRYLELAGSFLPYCSGFTLETDVVYPSVFFAHRITLCHRPISGHN
jgi:hypothetical protein